MEVREWILTGVVTVLLIIIGFMGKSGFQVVQGLLKSILEELKKLSSLSIKHDERIKSLEENSKDHENRIRTLETK